MRCKCFSLVAFLVAWFLPLVVWAKPPDHAASSGTCVADSETLCVNSGQFALRVNFDDGEMGGGPGTVLSVLNDASGFFFLDDDRHLDLFAQILDACSFNGHYWVTLIGLSDQAQTVTISESGMVVKTYENLVENFYGVSDTEAIPCAEAASNDHHSGAPPRSRGGAGPLPLTPDRFEITTVWEDFTMNSSDGNPVEVTPHSGYFWFFDASNPDVVVKVVDNSTLNGNFWVFFGSQTTVAFTLRVVDTCDGSMVSFTKPEGGVGGTVVDMGSFPSVSACEMIFFDGFESGDTTAWSASVG